MAITIDIDTARPYQVHVGTFLLEQAGPLVRATAGGAKAVIVTDTNVGPLYQMPVKQSLEASGYEVSICTFEAGEAHKRAETYVAILEFVAEHELSRSDVIVALGGGVVGDVAGFVAATYMRGCKFVQIPTSLLAMVDSSVGGKTAIDLAAGKNLAGAFWQPSVVIADVGCLATLTPEQFADGCGEVVKHAVIADPELFAELEKTPLTLELLNRDVSRVALIIARNIDIKRAVVGADERETNQTGSSGIKAVNAVDLGQMKCGLGNTQRMHIALALILHANIEQLLNALEQRALIALKLILYRQRRPPSLKIFLAQIDIQTALANVAEHRLARKIAHAHAAGNSLTNVRRADRQRRNLNIAHVERQPRLFDSGTRRRALPAADKSREGHEAYRPCRLRPDGRSRTDSPKRPGSRRWRGPSWHNGPRQASPACQA